jgi:hypothetical protein
MPPPSDDPFTDDTILSNPSPAPTRARRISSSRQRPSSIYASSPTQAHPEQYSQFDWSDNDPFSDPPPRRPRGDTMTRARERGLTNTNVAGMGSPMNWASHQHPADRNIAPPPMARRGGVPPPPSPASPPRRPSILQNINRPRGASVHFTDGERPGQRHSEDDPPTALRKRAASDANRTPNVDSRNTPSTKLVSTGARGTTFETTGNDAKDSKLADTLKTAAEAAQMSYKERKKLHKKQQIRITKHACGKFKRILTCSPITTVPSR